MVVINKSKSSNGNEIVRPYAATVIKLKDHISELFKSLGEEIKFEPGTAPICCPKEETNFIALTFDLINEYKNKNKNKKQQTTTSNNNKSSSNNRNTKQQITNNKNNYYIAPLSIRPAHDLILYSGGISIVEKNYEFYDKLTEVETLTIDPTLHMDRHILYITINDIHVNQRNKLNLNNILHEDSKIDEEIHGEILSFLSLWESKMKKWESMGNWIEVRETLTGKISWYNSLTTRLVFDTPPNVEIISNKNIINNINDNNNINNDIIRESEYYLNRSLSPQPNENIVNSLYELEWHYSLKNEGLTNVISLPRYDTSIIKSIYVLAEIWCGGSLLKSATLNTTNAIPKSSVRCGNWLSSQNLLFSQLPRESVLCLMVYESIQLPNEERGGIQLPNENNTRNKCSAMFSKNKSLPTSTESNDECLAWVRLPIINYNNKLYKGHILLNMWPLPEKDTFNRLKHKPFRYRGTTCHRNVLNNNINEENVQLLIAFDEHPFDVYVPKYSTVLNYEENRFSV